jgi:hypothetical protein
MTEPEILDQDIRAMQEWLRTAWWQLGNSAMTPFARRELRNHMKQCSADLRTQLQIVAQHRLQSQPQPASQPARAYGKPESRILVLG